jgi:hypothetical protein
MDLSTWDPSYYRSSLWMQIRQWLGAHRWRCEACRNNFVSWRPRREKYVRPGANLSVPAALIQKENGSK